jgi:hypothetical protein
VRGQRHAPAALYPGKEPVPIVQKAEWAPGQVWTGAENFDPTGIRSPDRPTRSQSLTDYANRPTLYPIYLIENLSSDPKNPTVYQSSILHKGSPSSPLYVSGRASHLVNYENRRKYTTEPIVFPSDNLLSGAAVDYSSSNMQVHENISADI